MKKQVKKLTREEQVQKLFEAAFDAAAELRPLKRIRVIQLAAHRAIGWLTVDANEGNE